VHITDFHDVVARSKGCVTCQGYHPTKKPLDRIGWVIKQSLVVEDQIRNAESELVGKLDPAEGSDLENALRKVHQAYEKVRKAREDVDKFSEELDAK
jgi:hypothetical protein